MKFTLSWLKDFLDTDASLEQIGDTLTAIGLEVEEISNPGEELRPFTVAEVLQAEKHPDADKLRVCKVNSGEAELTIVCGAPNARAGIKVALAREGTVIPTNGMKIKKSKIRGQESCGMLCSSRELGLGDDHAGIIELPENAQVGASIVTVLGLDDPVIDIAITPNRADCLGIRGIARDLAAAGLGTLKPLPLTTAGTKNRSQETSPALSACGASSPCDLQEANHGATKKQGQEASAVSVHIATEKCHQFIGCTIKGVKNGPSPDWMQQRLKAVGLRPISTLVDITNYITLAYGRPLHVYDIGKLTGDITVRAAKQGESFLALDGKEYTLENGMTAITDDSGVLGLGGIIGGESTGCDADTTDVFLECALFNAADIAITGRKLQIDSDARYRFERGVDPAFVENGAKLATQMITELCGGTAGTLVSVGTAPQWQRKIPFNPGRINGLGGTQIAPDNMQTILQSLGFTMDGDQVIPPSWRQDVEGEADLAEEVLRIHGYDAIPATPMSKPTQIATSHLTAMQKRSSNTRRALAARGLRECCNWSFVSEAQATLFGGVRQPLKLVNPISSELSVMRPSLLPHLIAAAQKNADRGHASLALFELGLQYHAVTPDGQQTVSAGVRTQEAETKNPHGAARPVDAFDVKADALAVLEAAGFNAENAMIDTEVPGWYHPGRAGRLTLGKKTVLGYFGELHPALLQQMDVELHACAFEVFLDAIPLPKSKGTGKPKLALSDFQATERDFAFLADFDMPAAELLGAVRRSDKQLLTDARIFDVYTGKGVEDGKKSVAIAVTLQAPDRTLTEGDIEGVSKKIIENAGKIGAILRK